MSKLIHTTREARRSSMAAASTTTTTNRFPRLRHRPIPLPHFSEEGQLESQDAARLRPVASKKDKDRDRDRDSTSHRNKRKRWSHREESEQSTEDTLENERDCEIEDTGVFRTLSPHTASSASDQNQLRILPPITPVRPKLPPSKIVDEMIGVTVPRKARSASAKRSHDNRASTSGGGEEQNFQQRSNSLGRQGVESASPSSSDESVRKKMKASGPRANVLKTSKLSSSNQEDIEIEIAELLYGLMTSKNQECSQKLETNDKHGISHDFKTSHSSPITNPHTSVSPPSTGHSFYPSTDVEKKVEDYNSSTLVSNNSTAESVKIECEQRAIVEALSPESATISGFNDENATDREAGSSEAPKEDITEENLNSGAGCGVTADGRPVSLKGELPSCSKLDVDEQDTAATRAVFALPEANSQRVEKFEIDLMAPPPFMVVSPESDDLSRGDFTSETKAMVSGVELRRENNVKVKGKVERRIMKEKREETTEMKMDAFKEKKDVLKFDLEKPYKDNDSTTSDKLEEQNRNQQQLLKSTNPIVEKPVQSSSVPLSTTVPGWPSSLPNLGRYMPPLQTVVKTDKTTGSSTTPRGASLVLSQPQPKRCATHYCIARNILHQQSTRMNHIWPAVVGSASLCGTKLNNVNGVPSAESMVVAKQSQKKLPGVNQNASQEKEWAATSFLGLTVNESSDAANSVDSTQRKQIVPRQGPHPASAGNLMVGPAFLFPVGQHQASVTAATRQAVGLNSTSTASSSNKSNSSAAGSMCSSSALPAVTAAMNFSYSNLTSNDAPYVTIVQNNGYPFPLSTSLGAATAIRGTSPAQATNILNGPFHSSQMFHAPQQHPHSQALVQPGYINTSTSNSSSSSHKQSRGAQVNGNNILTSSSTTMQLQRSKKQHTSQSNPRKLETEMSGENAPSFGSPTSYSQKNVYGQNFTVPVQPVNFSLRPSATSDSVVSCSGNFGEQQENQQALKGGVELIPSQAFGISFAAFNGISIPSNLNFSSMAQNPVIFQSLPDIAWQGYQAAGTSNTAQLKTYSISEGKSGGDSSHQDDEKKAISGKSPNNGPTTLNFDNSSKNHKFVLSPLNGSWPSRSIASAAITTNAPLPSNVSSSQQLLQLQKRYGMQQQQPSMATRYKASSTNTTSATKLVNNSPIFSQNPTQCNSSNQASQSKSSGRTTDSQVHHASIITSINPPIKKISQEQGLVLQGNTVISFGGNYKTPLPPHGQQLINNKSVCTKVAGSPANGGNLKPNAQGNKADSSINTLQMQQTENS